MDCGRQTPFLGWLTEGWSLGGHRVGFSRSLLLSVVAGPAASHCLGARILGPKSDQLNPNLHVHLPAHLSLTNTGPGGNDETSRRICPSAPRPPTFGSPLKQSSDLHWSCTNFLQNLSVEGGGVQELPPPGRAEDTCDWMGERRLSPAPGSAERRHSPDPPPTPLHPHPPQLLPPGSRRLLRKPGTAACAHGKS